MIHSLTLPCMSNSPHAFGFFVATGCGRSPEFSRVHAYSPSARASLPKLYAVVVPARAAYSHSASVGRRYVLPVFADSQRQYSIAACHVMLIAGCWPLPEPNGLAPLRARGL